MSQWVFITFAEMWHIIGKYKYIPTGLTINQHPPSYIHTINQS